MANYRHKNQPVRGPVFCSTLTYNGGTSVPLSHPLSVKTLHDHSFTKTLRLRRHATGFGFSLRHFVVCPPEVSFLNSSKKEFSENVSVVYYDPTQPKFAERRNVMSKVDSQPMDTLFVRQVTPSGPAEDAGLQPGDEIVSVNGQKVTGKTYPEIIQLIQQSDNALELEIVPSKEDVNMGKVTSDGYKNDKFVLNNNPENKQCIYNNETEIFKKRRSSGETDTPRSSTGSRTSIQSTNSDSGRKIISRIEPEIKRDLSPKAFVATLTESSPNSPRHEAMDYIDDNARTDKPEAYRKLSGHKVYVVSTEKADDYSSEENSPSQQNSKPSQIFNFSPALSQSSGHQNTSERRPSGSHTLAKNEPVVVFKTGDKLSFQFSFDPEESSKIGVPTVSTVTASKSTSNHSTNSDLTSRQPVAVQSNTQRNRSQYDSERRLTGSSSSGLARTVASHVHGDNEVLESSLPEEQRTYSSINASQMRQRVAARDAENIVNSVQVQIGNNNNNNTARQRRVSYVLATDGGEHVVTTVPLEDNSPTGQQPMFVHLEPMDLTPEEGNEADNEEEQDDEMSRKEEEEMMSYGRVGRRVSYVIATSQQATSKFNNVMGNLTEEGDEDEERTGRGKKIQHV